MIQIRSDFPGGNIRVLSVEGREVQLAPDLRDTEGPWFYWYFAARFSEPGRWHFSFPDGPAVGPRGAAFSCDGGLSWQFTDRIGAGDREFFYENDGSVPEVRFAVAPPYGLGELERFLAVTPGIMRGELCRSRGGLPVELLTVPGAADCRVLITARHHCCEMSANRVMEGILRQWCAGDQTGCELRRRATLLAVPFADRDGVEAGDQGKNRRPHDHARDYGHPGGAHLYPECAALDRLLEARPGSSSICTVRGCVEEAMRRFILSAPKRSGWPGKWRSGRSGFPRFFPATCRLIRPTMFPSAPAGTPAPIIRRGSTWSVIRRISTGLTLPSRSRFRLSMPGRFRSVRRSFRTWGKLWRR